ncbi:MAG: putative porin [Paramuribaculum sp.]|nr:putative porin [Paramuribaculum sp.]
MILRRVKALIALTVMMSGIITASAQSFGSGSTVSGSSGSSSSSSTKLPEQVVWAWKMLPPLGLRERVPVDTTLYNYYLNFVPNDVTPAWATTGNYGAEGMNMLYMERENISDFFFRDALTHWLPMRGNHVFYNSRIPITQLGYSTGGGKENTQDRLSMNFSGNVNRRIQVGAMLDYLYSKGSYANQSAKHVNWGLSGSYMGDRYELQAFYNHYNSLNKENGGITDSLYIVDPAVLQGGVSKIEPSAIPTNLSSSHNRLTGAELMVNNKLKFGFWKDLPRDTLETGEPDPADTIPKREFVAVSSVTWTLDYQASRHLFINKSSEEEKSFWENHYLSNSATHDVTKYWSLKNIVGLSLVEGFHKYAKFGLSAFMIHEIRKYNQTPDTVTNLGLDDLTPLPEGVNPAASATRNLLWVGGQLTKQRGSLLRYEATAKFGLLGDAIGEVDLDGNINTSIPLFGDTLDIDATGSFSNRTAPYLMNNYISNHFAWQNDFGKERRLRVGGAIDYSRSRTRIEVGVENVQNYLYFGDNFLPAQYSGSVQVFSASLRQNFKLGILHWDNRVTYQTSSNEEIIPLPKLAVYSNLYLWFKVAKVLTVQMGVDCDWYSEYFAPTYQPSTMAFCNQRSAKAGGYPFMNAYVNMKLSKTRFYVLFSHFNQGMIGGNNYFSMPLYPMNPRRFQMGLIVDFLN